MRDEMKKVPRLRFRGFQEDWELCKFERIFEKVKSYSLSREVETNEFTGMKYIHYGDIHTKKADKVSENSNIPNIIKKNYALLEIGDLILTDASEDYKGIATPAVIRESTSFDIVAGLHTIALRPKNIDPMFLYYLIKAPTFRKYGYKVGTGMKVFGISSSKVLDFTTYIPKNDETKLVSSFLEKLDYATDLHQRKLDQLKELKKAYLQVMFPVKDERVPKVRFAAFEDDWKLCKLGSILEERNEQMAENNEYYLMSFVQGKGVTPKGDRYDRSFLVKDEKKKYKKTEFGDFIYSSNNLERGSIGFNRTGKALISPVYSIFKSKNQLESQFIGILSERKSFINRMTKFRQGVVYGQWRIHEADFLNVEVRIPSHMEQKGIIKFFSNLDNMIIVHQNKLNQLKTLKKSYLQNMFI